MHDVCLFIISYYIQFTQALSQDKYYSICVRLKAYEETKVQPESAK